MLYLGKTGKLYEALRQYGAHRPNCDKWTYADTPCTCGWDQVSAGLQLKVEPVADIERESITQSALQALLETWRAGWPAQPHETGYLAMFLCFAPGSPTADMIGDLFDAFNMERPPYLRADPTQPIRKGRVVDFGVWWHAGKNQFAWRVSWDEETGVLYGVPLGGEFVGKRFVFGQIPTYELVENALSGWTDVIEMPGSLHWVINRAAEHTTQDMKVSAASFAQLDLEGLEGLPGDLLRGPADGS